MWILCMCWANKAELFARRFFIIIRLLFLIDLRYFGTFINNMSAKILRTFRKDRYQHHHRIFTASRHKEKLHADTSPISRVSCRNRQMKTSFWACFVYPISSNLKLSTKNFEKNIPVWDVNKTYEMCSSSMRGRDEAWSSSHHVVDCHHWNWAQEKLELSKYSY